MVNPFDLTGKVALITGGNRGIGFGMAEALGAAGADLVLWGRDRDQNSRAAEQLSALPIRVLTQLVDVSNEDQVVAAMAEAVSQMGRIDTVFANAGIAGKRERFGESQTSTYRNTLSVNLDGAYWTTREACKHMVERFHAGDGGGSVVTVASLGAIHGMAQLQPYAMAKAGMTGLARSIAVELGKYQVRANSIIPGWVETDMSVSLKKEAAVQRVLPRIPARRWGNPKDFGGIAVYLASDASAYHSGDSFIIDGGYAVF